MAGHYAVESDIVTDLPTDLLTLIGKIIVEHARLEYKLTQLAATILQLNRHEARIALREPRAEERLEIARDLLAIKDIAVQTDCDELQRLLRAVTVERDWLAHGIWLRSPKTGELFLRVARGVWPKAATKGTRIKRGVFPQSIPFGLERSKALLASIAHALFLVNDLGHEIDEALLSAPEKFRPPLPVLNPLGVRPKK